MFMKPKFCFDHKNEYIGDLSYDYLKFIIKMTEYTPISGGNITELNKIPNFF